MLVYYPAIYFRIINEIEGGITDCKTLKGKENSLKNV